MRNSTLLHGKVNDAMKKVSLRGGRIFALMMLLLSLTLGAKANPVGMNQTRDYLTVYDGSVTNSYVPVYGFYTDAYLKCEYIMPAAELTEMADSDINAVTYYLSNLAAADWGAAYFQVFMKEVDSTTINTYQGMDGATLVYEGPLDGTQAEMNITFTTPYHYYGGNLLVGIYNVEQGTYKSCSFYGESVSGASVQGYSYNGLDSISPTQRNFIPKTTFYYSNGNSVPNLVATPDPIDLGYRPNGAWMRPLEISIFNEGAETTINNVSITNNDYFLLSLEGVSVPFTLGHNDGFDLNLGTVGSNSGTIDANLVINYGENEETQFDVIATAYTPVSPDVWELAPTVSSFPYTATLNANSIPLYDNYRLPPTNIVDGVDAVYKLVFTEDTYLNASVTSGENGKVALYPEDFMGLGGPDLGNSYTRPQLGDDNAPFTAMIGDPNSTTTLTYFPFHTLWNYSLAENLFLASELVEAGVTNAPMTSLSWYVSSTTCTMPQNNISIWMGNVSDSELTATSHITDGMTLVYTGENILPTIGWNEFEFNQGTFSWDGNSNVLIVCQRNNGSWQGSVSWQTHNPGFTGMCYTYNDYDAYDAINQTHTMTTSSTNRANIIMKGGGGRNRDEFTCNFEGGMQGWTTIDNDGDGHTWFHSNNSVAESGYSYEGLGHGASDGFMVSASYSDLTTNAINADNYLVSPQKYSLETGANLNFFYDYGSDSYPDYFEVCVATADNPGANDFTSVWNVDMRSGAAKTTVRHSNNRHMNWRNVTVDLSAYVGQDVWIAFHHQDYDEYEVWIDDVTINACGGFGNDGTIAAMTVTPGTYYLVASSTSDEFTVEINTDEVPCPELATNPHPADAATEVGNVVNLTWNLDSRATEYRLMFGTTYYCEETLVDWTDTLSERYRVYGLNNNTNYFWRIDQRNDGCPEGVIGQVWGFTTHLNVPLNLYADNFIHLGDDLTLSWDDPNDRSFLYYNVYQDGELIGSTYDTYYTISNLSYNINPGYYFNVTAVYNEGESNFSNTRWVRVTGEGTVEGYVYEQDGVTPIQGARVEFQGTGEIGGSYWYYYYTDENGHYSFNMMAGTYTGTATHSGYQYAQHGSFIITYNELTTNINFVMDELFNPVSEVVAEYYPDVENPESSYVKVYWGIDDSSNWLYYDDGVNVDAIGLTAGGSFYWGVMFPAGTFAGSSLKKVSMYDYAEHTGNIMVYQGGTTAPGSLLYTQPYTCTGSMDFVEWTLNTPVAINPSLPLWIVMNNNGGQYVASCCANTGDANGRWISLDGATWEDLADYGLNYTWMIRAYVTNGAKGEYVAPMGLVMDVAPTKVPASMRGEMPNDYGLFSISGSTTTHNVGVPSENVGNTRAFSHYRVYRTDAYNNGPFTLDNTVLIADEVIDTLLIDVTWPNVEMGVYKWGVGCVYVGNRGEEIETPIHWTEPMAVNNEKGNRDLTVDFESGLPTGWNVIDGNNDSLTWTLTSSIPTTWTYYAGMSLDWYHGGSNAICSGSYINGYGAVTPDEYLVSPQVSLGTGSSISFWVAATDANYPADHFGVFVSDDGTSGWTSVQEWTLSAKKSGLVSGGRASRDGNGFRLGTWYNYTVDLSAYDGLKYVAFRHFDCYDQYIMCLDDISIVEGDGIGGLQEPRESEIVWSNFLDKDMYLVNGDVNVTVTLNSGDSPEGVTVSFINLNPVEQQLHPVADITLGNTGYYAWDSFRRGDYQVTVGKEGYSSIHANVSIWDATSLSYILEEMIPFVSDLYVSSTGWAMWAYGEEGDTFSYDFDSGIPSDWTTIDADGDGYTWVSSMNPGIYHNSGIDLTGTGHNASTAYVISASYANQTAQILYPDNYLVSPQVTLAAGSTFSFWACAQDASYAADHFGVFVSDNGISNWTIVQEWTMTAKSGGDVMSIGRGGNTRAQGNWYYYTVDLGAYAGQKYIAIRHFNCADQFILNVDDIELTFGRNSGRHLEYSQVILTDIQDNVLFSGNTMDPFIQLPVDDLVEGETYQCSVASVFTTGMTGWSEVEWVYQACDNYEGTNSVFATTTNEGNLISWEFLGNMSGLSNNLSTNAHLLCLDGATQSYSANVNAGTGEAGPDYGCLSYAPNPSWYYMKIDNPGNIDVYMYSEPSVDIDFCCWGPFDDPVSPCPDGLTSDKIVDCSYSASWNETCHIPETAQSGEYYILLLTNYSNQVCDFYFEKQDGTGTTVCEDYAIGTMIFRDGEWLGLSSESSYLDEGETGNHQYTIRMVYGGPAVCPGNNIYYSMSCPQTAFMGETYQITATASPSEGGSIVGAGIYGEGVTCTLTATANEGYTFLNWTKDGIIVSTEASYSFTATEDAAYVANFISDTDHWSVDIHQYPYNMSVTGIIWINGVEQAVPTLEIGAFCGEECRGAQRLTYFPQVDRYLVFFTLYGDAGDVMSFRLYDHSIGEELDLSCSSTISFVPDGFIGTAFDPYVFNFGNTTMVEQVSTFSEGYNWWSTYIEQEGIDGLGMLQEGLGDNGVSIRSQASGYTDYYAGYGWYGSLSSINNESSYRVITNAPCTVTMTGDAAVPSQHPITLGQGWTWIGYVPSAAMSVDAAMANVNAVAGDKVKSQQGYADYYEGYGWYGSLNTIEPGMGLMYYSTNGSPVTFTYPDNNRGGELKANLTAENNHWVPNVHAYPDNMTVMAVIELDGVEVTSDNYELAAFANGECRGSVKLMYAEPLHRHVAFLTISGKDAAELSFRLYNTETGLGYYDAEESLDFVANAIVGEANDLYVVHFRGTTSMDEFASRVKVYPNPVNAGERFIIGMNMDAKLPIPVEIINTLGAVVSMETSTQAPVSIVAPITAGVYTLRITVEGKGTVVRKLVVK